MRIKRVCSGVFLLLQVALMTTSGYAQERSTWDAVPGSVRDRNAFKRIEWFYRTRALPNDTIPASVFEREREREMEKTSTRTAEAIDLTWTGIGPTGIQNTWPPQWGIVAGRLKSIVVHPTDPNIAYIGAASGGIWKTTDGGATWQDVGVNLESLTFGAIALNPLNPNTVYAGSGEAYIYGGYGLYKSLNGGTSWTRITNGFGAYTNFRAIKVSPTDTNYVYAALTGQDWLVNPAPGNEGLWRSTNGGTTWTRTGNYYHGDDVLPHPTTAGRVYAATGAYWSGTAGFYFSSNSGSTWTLRNSGLPASNTIERILLARSPASTAALWALVHTVSPDQMTLYKTTNEGVSWTSIGPTITCDGGWWNLLVAVNPSDTSEIYLGENELRRSTNGGASYSHVGGAYWDQSMHVDFQGFAFAPSNPAIRYCISDGGVYRSSNSGSTWVSVNNNLSTVQYYRIGSHTTNQNIIIGGAQDNGIYRTTNGGSGTWTLVSTGDGMETFFDYSNPNTVYSSTQNGWILKSTSGGNWGTWSGVQPATSDSWAWLTPFFMHPTDNLTLYTASQRPWKSTNGGASWSDLAGSALTTYGVNTMAQSPVQPNNLMLSEGAWASDPDIYVTSTGGAPWTNIKANIGGAARHISRIIFHPSQPSTVFIVRSGFTSGSPGNKIYMSTNLGSTWQNLTGDLPDVPHSDLFIDPLNTSHMYTANDLGVYRTTNGGTSWTRQGNGMPFVPAVDFDYFNSGGVRLLRIATHGRGAFQAALQLPPATPVLLSPPDSATGQPLNPVLSWTATAGAIRYHLQVSANSGFTSLVVNDSTLTLTSKQVGPLSLYTTYYWRVRAENTGGESAFSSPRRFTVSPAAFIVVNASWNVVSIPLLVDDYRRTTLFSTSTSSAFAYQGTYVTHDTLENKIGYWLKFPSAQTVEMTGTAISSDSISVVPEWNLIGSISSTISVSSIIPIGTTIQSPFFAFDNGYASSTDIVPGKGYWVKVSTAGKLVLNSAAFRHQVQPAPDPLVRLSSLIISSANGALQKLYFGKLSGGDTLDFELPPNPPEGTPDIRFASGRFAELFDGSESSELLKPIQMQGVTYPITVAWQLLSEFPGEVALLDPTGLATVLSTDGSAVISSPGAGGLAIRIRQAVEIPRSFNLAQNYPNPFNPSTTFAFDVPSTSFVSLKVYDILGREVATVVNEEKKPGRYEVTWDANGIASGLYFYRMQAGTFDRVRKLVLMK